MGNVLSAYARFSKMENDELKDFLEGKYIQYSRQEFIETDPVSIPHLFTKKEDREIAGFLAAAISWGQRKTILKNARQLLHRMDDAPYEFILNFKKADLRPFKKFVHRTFNGIDCTYYLESLQHLYKNSGGLQEVFEKPFSVSHSLKDAITEARRTFFALPHPGRTLKHFADPSAGSAAKRINMFLRWMTRKDSTGVDFGIWKEIKPSMLICPIDVHSGRVARKLDLLSGKQNNWKAAEELTLNLKMFDPDDPVKYDFALFGLGVFEKF